MTITFAPSGARAMNIIKGWQFTEVLNDEAGEPVPDSLSNDPIPLH
jgi:hypothetical protein